MNNTGQGGGVARRLLRDVVVLLPGLTGSVLRTDGKDLWGPSTGSLLRIALSRGRRLHPLILQEDPVERDDLGDGVVATRVFPDVHLIPGLWKIDGYSRLGETLCRSLGLVPGRNYFELPYDWRRDIRVAARLLARRAHEWLARWRKSSGHGEARLVLVAHSMGGLVARAFLELHDGWRTTRALVAFGTPFRGSPNALDALCNGSRKGPRGLVDLTELVPLVHIRLSAAAALPLRRCRRGSPRPRGRRHLAEPEARASGPGAGLPRRGSRCRRVAPPLVALP